MLAPESLVNSARVCSSWFSLRQGYSYIGAPGWVEGLATCLPSLMLTAAWVIFLVTNDSPRRGDSWLNRIPLQAYMP